jgi:hypothetical protein
VNACSGLLEAYKFKDAKFSPDTDLFIFLWGNVMKYITTLILALVSSNLWAIGPGAPGSIPEPETLLLVGIGAVALLATRNKRK